MEAFRHLENFSDYVDLAGGLGRIRGNQKVYKMLLATFTKSVYLEQLRDEVQRSDIAAAAATAHAVKGMAANLSLDALHSVAANLETQLKAGEMPPESVDEFCKAYETTIAYVDAVMAEMEKGPLEV